jgi:hypothetical protein
MLRKLEHCAGESADTTASGRVDVFVLHLLDNSALHQKENKLPLLGRQFNGQ